MFCSMKVEKLVGRDNNNNNNNDYNNNFLLGSPNLIQLRTKMRYL